MALTAAAGITTHGPDSWGSFVVVSGTTIYKGAMVGLVVGTGTVTNYDDAAGHAFLGYALNEVVGDGSLMIQVNIRGDIIKGQTVTGISAVTSNWLELYATDENTFTTTRPADDALPIGVGFYNGSTVDIFLFSAKEQAVLALAGGSKRRLHVGRIHTTALEGSAAVNLVTSYPLWGHGLIVDFVAKPDGFDASYAAGSQNLNLEIGGTNVTGGVLALVYTSFDALADVDDFISASTITAANEFHDGDLLDIELAASGTGFTAGVDNTGVDLYIDVEYRAGA